MATDETTTAGFAIALDDQTSGPAKNAASALEDLKSKLDGDTKALREMQAAMSRLKGATTPNTAEMKKLKDQIDAQKAKIATAQASYIRLGGTFGDVKKKAEATGHGLDKLLGASKRLPGPLGGVASALDDVNKLVGGGGAIAAGTVAIAAAFVLLVAGIGAATVALLQYGVAQSDARRSELLHLEGLNALHEGMAAQRANATAAQSAIDRVTDSMPLARTQIVSLADGLRRAGYTGADFERRLRAAADRTARLRFGDNIDSAMSSLSVQSMKLHENIGRIFSGLRIEGLLSAMRMVTDLFSQNTASGRALKAIVEALFNPLIEGIGKAGPLAKRFFQGLVIGALHLTIIILQVRNWLRRTFGDTDLFKNVDALKVALWAGVVVFGALALAAGGLAVALGVVVISLGLLAAPFVIVVAAVAAMVVGFKKAFDWLGNQDWASIGSSIIDGLVSGLVRGKDLVVSTMRTIAQDATNTLTQALDIHSPSRVFAELGQQIPRGLAVGVQEASPVATGAIEDMTRGTGEARTSARSGAVVNVGPITIEIHSTNGNADEIVETLKEKIEKIFEGVAIQIGAQPT